MRPATASRSSFRASASAVGVAMLLAGMSATWAAGPAPGAAPAKPVQTVPVVPPATSPRLVTTQPAAPVKPPAAKAVPAPVVKALPTVVPPSRPVAQAKPAPVSPPRPASAPGTRPATTSAASRAEQARMAEAVAMEREKIDSVVAASLVGAMTDELGGRPIKLRLEQLQVQPTSLRDRLVSGHGQIQIDGEDDWIGFRFNTLYDTLLESASYPEFNIGLTSTGRVVPNDSALVRQLDDRVVGMLSEEFGYQHVRLQLDSISTTEAGRHYLRIDANGFADFGRDGVAPTRVEALYDRQRERWLRVVYALEPSGTLPVPATGPAATPTPLSR